MLYSRTRTRSLLAPRITNSDVEVFLADLSDQGIYATKSDQEGFTLRV
eukprot:COSAG01_NODE_908_length_12794_cov_119.794171_4_plen_48_part_00